VPHPTQATNFRPISCYTVTYKVISKLLCKRLKQVLPDLINQSQGAFVQGHELLHNVLLCQELARGYDRKHISSGCLMKIDLKKAYDSVYWSFIIELLEGLNSPPPHIHQMDNSLPDHSELYHNTEWRSSRTILRGERAEIRGPSVPPSACLNNGIFVKSIESYKHKPII